MFRWSRNVPQNTDLGYNLGALLGGLWAKNYADRGEAKNNKAYIDFITNPINVDGQQTTITAPDNTGQAVRERTNQGLLSSSLLGNTNFAPETQTPNFAFNNTLLGGAQSTPAQPTPQLTNPMDKYSKENNPVTTTTKTLSLKERETEWNKQFGERVRALPPEVLKQYGNQILQMRQEGLAKVKSDYNNEQSNTLIGLASNSTNKTEKIRYLAQLGQLGVKLDPQLLKTMLPEDKFHIQFAPDGTMFIQNQGTGSIAKGDKYAKPESPYKSAGGGVIFDNQTGQPVYVKPSSGGGGAIDKNKIAMFKWASGYDTVPTGEVDYNGKPIMTKRQRNPQLAAQLAAELGLDGGEQGQGEDPRVAAARAAGYSDEEIATYLQGSPMPQKQITAKPAPQTATANYMGETVTDAPVGYTPQLPTLNPVDEDIQRKAWLGALGR